MIKTRLPAGSPIHADPWFGSKVKLKKVTLMIFPAGTVIFQVQLLFGGKLLGKLGLLKTPLDPLRNSPGGTHAAKEIDKISYNNRVPYECTSDCFMRSVRKRGRGVFRNTRKLKRIRYIQKPVLINPCQTQKHAQVL